MKNPSIENHGFIGQNTTFALRGHRECRRKALAVKEVVLPRFIRSELVAAAFLMLCQPIVSSSGEDTRRPGCLERLIYSKGTKSRFLGTPCRRKRGTTATLLRLSPPRNVRCRSVGLRADGANPTATTLFRRNEIR
jgi:hypothetical protein